MPDNPEPKVCRMVEPPAPPPESEPAGEGMAVLSREEILSAPMGGEIHAVPVPEWGKGRGVLIREWTGRDRDAFEESVSQRDNKLANFRARLCASVICNDKGQLLFTGEDVVDLGRKSARALDRIFSAAAKVNGLSARDVEEMEKNSGGVPSANSGSVSPVA